MNNITWNKNKLNINGKITSFEQDILEAQEFSDFIFIVTTPQKGVTDNLYGVSIDNGQMWQVQNATELYPQFSQTPYVGISIIDGNAIVTDFCGCRFIINPANGKITGRASSVK